MAATGKTPILLYGSTTATNTPSAGNLTNSSDGCEIAINVADKNLFFKDSTNVVNTVPIRQSSASSNGWLSSTDWSTFNSKQPAGTYVTSVTGTAPVVSSGGTTPAISMAAATGSVNGYLTSTDWTTFNSKQAALVSGTNIKTVNGTTLLGSGDLGTIGIAYGGTNATSFNAPASSINGLVWYDGTRLVNDATTSDIGYNSSTNTLYAKNVSASGTVNFSGLTASNIVTTDASKNLVSLGVTGSGNAVLASNATLTSPFFQSGCVAGDSANGVLFLRNLSSRNRIDSYNWPISGTYAMTINSSELQFQIADATKMYLFNSGGVSIGNTTDPGAGKLSVTGAILSATGIYAGTASNATGDQSCVSAATGVNVLGINTAGTGSQTMIRFLTGNNANLAGTITTNTTTTAYNTSSDYRLKDNIQPMQNALARNAQLKPVTYEWKHDGSAGEGFIAHELQAVFKNAVTGKKDDVDENGNPVYQGIDTSFLVGHLVACIQELTIRVEQLENKGN